MIGVQKESDRKYNATLVNSSTTGTTLLLVRPGDMFVEGLALGLGDLVFEGGGLTRTISASESASAPWRAW